MDLDASMVELAKGFICAANRPPSSSSLEPMGEMRITIASVVNHLLVSTVSATTAGMTLHIDIPVTVHEEMVRRARSSDHWRWTLALCVQRHISFDRQVVAGTWLEIQRAVAGLPQVRMS
ncbi:MAG: hypothetical protein R2705_21365 [Ilumatobacteraceae bacterium]